MRVKNYYGQIQRERERETQRERERYTMTSASGTVSALCNRTANLVRLPSGRAGEALHEPPPVALLPPVLW